MALKTAIISIFDLDNDKTLINLQSATETRCLRCNRRLSHPDSIERGMGAYCARTIAYETRRKQEIPSYTFTPRTASYFSRKDQQDQQERDSQPATFAGQQSNGFNGMKTIESNENRSYWPVMDAIADHLIPECCCCERVLVQGQLAEFVYKKLDRDVYFCKDCHTKACEPQTNYCELERMTRPSPLTEFMSLISS